MVQFNGSDTAITELEELFNGMAATQLMGVPEQLPDFVKETTGHFYGIRWEDGVLYYETLWYPNTKVLRLIADRYQVDFIQDYAETRRHVYGQVVYKNGIVTDTFLETEDFYSFTHQPENDTWLFEGKEYPDFIEILEILLQRKINK